MYVHTIIPHLCSSWGPTTHCKACGVAMYHVLPPYAVLLRYSCAGDMILGSRSELKPCVLGRDVRWSSNGTAGSHPCWGGGGPEVGGIDWAAGETGRRRRPQQSRGRDEFMSEL